MKIIRLLRNNAASQCHVTKNDFVIANKVKQSQTFAILPTIAGLQIKKFSVSSVVNPKNVFSPEKQPLMHENHLSEPACAVGTADRCHAQAGLS